MEDSALANASRLEFEQWDTLAASSNSTTVSDDLDVKVLAATDRIGLSFIAEAGFISLSALTLLFVLLLRNAWRYRRQKGKWALVQSPADAFFLSLFVADVLQALGAVLDMRWAHRGIVEIGTYCDVQGVFQQLGETAVALATLTITIHTFAVVWMRKEMSLRLAYLVISLYWLYVALFVIIASKVNHGYYKPTPYWCWVAAGIGDRLAGEYIWLWLTLGISVLVYVPLFLWNLGYLAVDEDRWWKVSLRSRASLRESGARTQPPSSSLAIIAYPFAYSIVVLPVSIFRWREFQNPNSSVPSAATFAGVFLHDMFGAVNVLLLLATRPNLLLFGRTRLRRRGQEQEQHGRRPSGSSGGGGGNDGRLGVGENGDDEDLEDGLELGGRNLRPSVSRTTDGSEESYLGAGGARK